MYFRYTDPEAAEGSVPPYVQQIAHMGEAELTTMYVHFKHVEAYHQDLARAITEEYYR